MSPVSAPLRRLYQSYAPSFVREAYWRVVYRHHYPALAKAALGRLPKPPSPGAAKTLFILAMPRTGSTLAKRYLGGADDMEVSPYGRFEDALERGRILAPGLTLIDKATSNIDKVETILKAGGGSSAFLILVRDPRDQLCSLWEADFHKDVLQDELFWASWSFRYGRLLRLMTLYGRWGGRVSLLRYEDLATRPEATTRAFRAWLEKPQVAATRNYEPLNADQLGQAQEDPKVHRTSIVHSNSIGRWRNVQGTRRKVLAAWRSHGVARALMARLGYEPPGEPVSVRGIENLND